MSACKITVEQKLIVQLFKPISIIVGLPILLLPFFVLLSTTSAADKGVTSLNKARNTLI